MVRLMLTRPETNSHLKANLRAFFDFLEYTLKFTTFTSYDSDTRVGRIIGGQQGIWVRYRSRCKLEMATVPFVAVCQLGFCQHSTPRHLRMYASEEAANTTPVAGAVSPSAPIGQVAVGGNIGAMLSWSAVNGKAMRFYGAGFAVVPLRRT